MAIFIGATTIHPTDESLVILSQILGLSMMCTVCYTIWFPILACQSSWHYTFTTRQCFQDCLLRLHIRYSEGRQNPNIAQNSTQEVKEIQIMSKIKYSDGRQTKYCSKQHSEGRNPNIAPNSTQKVIEIQILS